MRISDWSSDVCSSDLSWYGSLKQSGDHLIRVRHAGELGVQGGEVDPVQQLGADRLAVGRALVEGGAGVGDHHHVEAQIGADPDAGRHAHVGGDAEGDDLLDATRSEEHTSELQSLMRISYAVFCLKKKIKHQ